MLRICATCKKPMGEKEPLEDKRVTHGICPACLRELEKEIESPAIQEKIKKEIEKWTLRTGQPKTA